MLKNCVPLANGQCLPPPPIFDIPPPPDPSEIWNLISLDKSSLDAIKKIRLQNCEWNPFRNLFGLGLHDGDAIYLLLSALLFLTFITTSTMIWILHAKCRCKNRHQPSSLNSSAAHSKLSAETVTTTGNTTSTWLRNKTSSSRQNAIMISAPIAQFKELAYATSSDERRNRTSLSKKFQKSKLSNAGSLHCYPRHLIPPWMVNSTLDRRRPTLTPAEVPNSPPMDNGFIRYHSQCLGRKHSTINRVQLKYHNSPSSSVEKRRYYDLVSNSNGRNSHYEEFNDGEIPPKFWCQLNDEFYTNTMRNETERRLSKLPFGPRENSGMCGQGQSGRVSESRQGRMPPPETPPPPPPAEMPAQIFPIPQDEFVHQQRTGIVEFCKPLSRNAEHLCPNTSEELEV